MLDVHSVTSTVLTLCALKFHLDLDKSECMYYRGRKRGRGREKGEGKGKIPVYL